MSYCDNYISNSEGEKKKTKDWTFLFTAMSAYDEKQITYNYYLCPTPFYSL